MGQDRTFIWKSQWKQFGQKAGWGGPLGNHQDETNSVSQVDGDSDMMPTCWLCGSLGGGLRKGTVASATLLSGRELTPHLSS